MGATLKVDDTAGSGCDQYSTIQAAVNAAAPGDKIQVCPGTYTEQVTVPAGKNGLSLESQKPLQAIIQAPSALTAPNAIVRVSGSTNVSLSKFTIQGPGPGGCGTINNGVRVDGGGSANIFANHITAIRDNPFSGCQNGVAIQIGRQAESTTGSANISLNVIDDYQKNGITVDNTGSSANITLNSIRGAGPTPTIAQNGVQVSRGANANVSLNSIQGNAYTGDPNNGTSTGVLLFNPGNVDIGYNSVRDSDTGIYAIGTNGGTEIEHNVVSGSTYDGISLDTATGTSAHDNNSSDNAGAGVGLYATTGSLVDNNDVEDNQASGLFADTDTSGNKFTRNAADDNAPFDCEDRSAGTGTAGTANTWQKNTGDTSSPAGLCTPKRGNGHGGGHGGGHGHGHWHPGRY
jgi:parallel beta-helix repeat protein